MYVIDTNTSCGNCTSFICEGNETNILNIKQNGQDCVTFQRNGQVVHSDCENLSLRLTAIVPNKLTSFLSKFVVEGEQCLHGGIQSISVTCSDALFKSKELDISMRSILIATMLY